MYLSPLTKTQWKGTIYLHTLWHHVILKKLTVYLVDVLYVRLCVCVCVCVCVFKGIMGVQ